MIKVGVCGHYQNFASNNRGLTKGVKNWIVIAAPAALLLWSLQSGLFWFLVLSAWEASYQSDTWVVFYVFDLAIAVAAGLFGPYLGFVGAFVVTSISAILFTVVFSMQFKNFCSDRSSLMFEFGPNFKFPGLDSGLVLYVDHVSYSFALLTSVISSFVYLYAFSYMRNEKNVLNFLVYFKLFGWSMILLVLSGSWVTLLLGWELIGITSFLLINFWTSKVTTLKSAFKAFAFNKVSDAALIAAVCLNLALGSSYINSSASFVNSLAGTDVHVLGVSVSLASVLLFLLVIAGFCKSAQFGFHFWLPDSMEAPVPASALIHSATLVSAGIYLLVRFNGLFFYCPLISQSFAVLTAFTAFYGAVIAAFQTDVKKILAYSTISHCGLLMFSILMHSPFVTLFYLFAHGFFKSINFMCVGNFIQHANNYQDLSRMGGFASLFKFELYVTALTLFNLSSAPLFFCFFSKHWLLGFAYSNSFVGSIAVSLVFAAAFSSAFYGSKIFYESMFSIKRSHYSTYSAKNLGNQHLSFRRSNLLGRRAISGLLLASFLVLFAFWNEFFVEITALSDSFSASYPKSYGSAFYLSHVYFSLVLATLFSGYSSFKRGGTYGFEVLGFAAMFGILCAI